MLSRFSLKDLTTNQPQFLSIATLHPAFFMSQINDPNACPAGIPAEAYAKALAAAQQINECNFSKPAAQLKALSSELPDLVRYKVSTFLLRLTVI